MPSVELVRVNWVSYSVIVHPPTKRYSYVSGPLVAKKVCAYRLKAMLQLINQKLARKLGKL
jgi:hypothetical protein